MQVSALARARRTEEATWKSGLGVVRGRATGSFASRVDLLAYSHFASRHLTRRGKWAGLLHWLESPRAGLTQLTLERRRTIQEYKPIGCPFPPTAQGAFLSFGGGSTRSWLRKRPFLFRLHPTNRRIHNFILSYALDSFPLLGRAGFGDYENIDPLSISANWLSENISLPIFGVSLNECFHCFYLFFFSFLVRPLKLKIFFLQLTISSLRASWSRRGALPRPRGLAKSRRAPSRTC